MINVRLACCEERSCPLLRPHAMPWPLMATSGPGHLWRQVDRPEWITLTCSRAGISSISCLYCKWPPHPGHPGDLVTRAFRVVRRSEAYQSDTSAGLTFEHRPLWLTSLTFEHRPLSLLGELVVDALDLLLDLRLLLQEHCLDLPGTVLNLRTTTWQKCEAAPRRARI